jgi:GT2 family glycosyltransferase
VKLSVIIVNYNVRYYLEQALVSAIKACEGVDAEIIVVDNASIDGSNKMMLARFPEVRYIYLDQNTGFSKGNNIGIKASEGDYVLLLNPDTLVAEDAIKLALQRMDEDELIGGLGVHMIDGSGKFLPESKRGLPTPLTAFFKVFGFSTLFPLSKRFGKYHLSYLNKEDEHEVEVLSGAFMMMRRSALDKAGLLDEAFFMYGEDIDLSYRLIKAGYKNLYYPKSRIIHYKGESTKKGSVNYVFVFYRAMIIFAKKHFEKGQASTFGFLINMAIYFRALLAIIRRFFGKVWQAMLDGSIAFFSFYLATQWYANFAGKNFELPFLTTSLFTYAAVTAIVLVYANVYDSNYKIERLFKGWLIALLVLLGIYALLPESYRFSRAVILIGTIVSLAGGITWRKILSVVNDGSDDKSSAGQRILVVGNERSLKDIMEFLESHALQPRFVAGISLKSASVYPLDFLSHLGELQSAVTVFKIDQVIFDLNVVTYSEMIKTMEACNELNIDFKMASGDPIFITGSQDVISEKEVLKVGELRMINVQAINRLKRTLDLFIFPVLFLALPVLLLISDEKRGVFLNMWALFTGKKTLVGLDPRGHHPLLPKLANGIVYPDMNIIIPVQAEKQLTQKNLAYLKHYSPWGDIGLFFRYIHAFGNL